MRIIVATTPRQSPDMTPSPTLSASWEMGSRLYRCIYRKNYQQERPRVYPAAEYVYTARADSLRIRWRSGGSQGITWPSATAMTFVADDDVAHQHQCSEMDEPRALCRDLTQDYIMPSSQTARSLARRLSAVNHMTTPTPRPYMCAHARSRSILCEIYKSNAPRVCTSVLFISYGILCKPRGLAGFRFAVIVAQRFFSKWFHWPWSRCGGTSWVRPWL